MNLHRRLLVELRRIPAPGTPLKERLDMLAWARAHTDEALNERPFSFATRLRVVGTSPMPPSLQPGLSAPECQSSSGVIGAKCSGRGRCSWRVGRTALSALTVAPRPVPASSVAVCLARLRCSDCRHEGSLISGTTPECGELPRSRWVLDMQLQPQSKNNVSAAELVRQVAVSSRPPRLVKRKTMQAMRLCEKTGSSLAVWR
jgi:hypothetical protein